MNKMQIIFGILVLALYSIISVYSQRIGVKHPDDISKAIPPHKQSSTEPNIPVAKGSPPNGNFR
jgi:hypothetical protein